MIPVVVRTMIGSLSKDDFDDSENVIWNVTSRFFNNVTVFALPKCVLTILELNWNQRFWDNKTKWNICHHMLTSSTQLQNRSFHVVERTRTSSKCQKKKNTRAKRAKILFFIVKYANLWGFCCRRRRGYWSSLMKRCLTTQVTRKTIFRRNLLTGKYFNNESLYQACRCPQGHWNHRKQSS